MQLCWFVAEINLEKKIQSSTQMYHTPSKTAKCNKKKYYCLKMQKNVSFWENWLSCLILCFLEIPKIFICVRVKQVTFLSEEWIKLSVWRSVLFTVSDLEMCEREAYRKQTGSNVPDLLNKFSSLEHDQFMQVSL